MRWATRSRRVVGDRGQAAPLVMLVVAVALVGIVVVARLGVRADAAARARTAADAAALAGAVDGREGADAMAVANGATLVDFRPIANGVEVVVRVDDIDARARAEVSVSWVSPG